MIEPYDGDEPYNGLRVGDRVRIVQDTFFQGSQSPADTRHKVAVGLEGFVTKLGHTDPSKWNSIPEQNRHVVFNKTEREGHGNWVQVEALELIDPLEEEKQLEDALLSISEAARHQEYVLIFKSIILADVTGKEIRVTVETTGNMPSTTVRQVVLYDEDDNELITFDVDNWTNLQEAMELAFRQIDPMSTGKEKK